MSSMIAISTNLIPISRSPQVMAATAAFVVGTLASVAIFWPAWRSMAMLWWSNETYTHGMLVPAACLWLGWREAFRFRGITPHPTRTALPLLALCALGGLVGYLAGVNALQHFAAVTTIVGLFLLCFGWRISREAAFSLVFLYFAVPFGEFLMPWLMDRTADFTIAAVKLIGIPVMRDGRNFVLPSGNWSVVEACSGLRYLLAAIPLGLLYAQLNFRSLRTKLVYSAGVVVIALVANWIRAYLIVMIGHLSDMKLAAGVDHLVYGWLFFGIVMGAAFWFGSRMPELGTLRRKAVEGMAPAAATESTQAGAVASAAIGRVVPNSADVGAPTDDEDESHDAAINQYALSGASVSPRRQLVLLGSALVLLAAAPLAAKALQASGKASVQLQAYKSGMDSDVGVLGDYQPGYRDEREKAIGKAPSSNVGIAAFRYQAQHQGGEMITHGNGVLPHKEGTQAWSVRRQSQAGTQALPGAAAGGAVNEYEIESRGGKWLVWEWFWVDGRVYADPRRVKIATAVSVLSARGDESVAFMLWTPLDSPLGPARERLASEAARLVGSAQAAGMVERR